MALDTWVSIGVLAGFAAALFGYLTTIKSDLMTAIGETRAELKAEIADTRTELKTEIAETRAELKTEISETRAELKTDIRGLGDRMISLENRTYDISTRLPATSAGPTA